MEGFITLHGKDGYGRTTNVLVNLANVCEFREVGGETRILYRDKDKTVAVIEYGINCDLKPIKGPQKFIVYWRKYHVATFDSEEAAREDCAKRNADKERYVAELRKAKGIDLSNAMVQYSIREELGELLKMATEIRVRAERIEKRCKELMK